MNSDVRQPRVINKYDFDFFANAIKNNLPIAISGGANFLAALGLVSYTEFLGGLMRNQLGVRGESEANFSYAFHALGSGYKVFDGQVQSAFNKSFYSIFRCGLVHEYFAKEPFVIAQNNRGALGAGWAGTDQRIALATQNYYNDLLGLLDRVKVEIAP